MPDTRAMGADRTSDRLRFGGIEFDTRTGEIWKDGSRTVLPDQLFRVLAMLVREHGSLVTRDELRRVLWPDETFVDFEQGLNAAIKRLRDVIGDSAAEPRFIETIPRRGYRFVASVEQVGQPDAIEPHVEPIAVPKAGRRRWVAVTAAVLALGGVAAIAFHRDGSRPSPDDTSVAAKRLVRMTTAGINISPALSPDGSLLAYASDRADPDGFDIWIQPTGGATATRITSDPGDEVEPSFSPDGRSIVYAKREFGGIYVVDARGGTPLLLAPATRARTPRFSPDGRWIVFWTGQTVWTSGLAVGSSKINGVSTSLGVVPSVGGPPRTLADDFVSARYPVWSPDGRSILFLGERQSDNGPRVDDWFVIGLDSNRVVQTGAFEALSRAGVTGAPLPAAWMAHNEVVFTTATDDASNVWRVMLSPQTLRVSGAPTRVTFGSALERAPSVTASGDIVFESATENVDIWRMALDAVSGVASHSLERVTDDASRDILANVSDDGTILAFASSRTGRNEGWLKDLRTGREHQITHSGVSDMRLSPDGSQVAVNSRIPSALQIYATQGGEPTTVCNDCAVGGWSADGTRMVAGRPLPQPQRFVFEVASRHESPVAAHPQWYLNQPRLSSDNRWVIFHTTNDPALRQIFAVPAFTGRNVPPEAWVPVVTDYGIQPTWAPDDAGVYHFSNRDGYFCAWLQPVDPSSKRPTGLPRAVMHFHQPRLRAAVGAGSTNDVQHGYLYITLTETTGNIWMLHSHTPTLTAAR